MVIVSLEYEREDEFCSGQINYAAAHSGRIMPCQGDPKNEEASCTLSV